MQQVLKDNLDHLDLKELWDQPDQRVHKALRVVLVEQERQVPLAHKALEVLQVQQDSLATQVQPVSLAFLVQEVNLDLRAIQVSLDLKAQLVRLALSDPSVFPEHRA